MREHADSQIAIAAEFTDVLIEHGRGSRWGDALKRLSPPARELLTEINWTFPNEASIEEVLRTAIDRANDQAEAQRLT